MQINNIMVMLEFLEKAGISTKEKGMNATFDEQENKLILKKEEWKGGKDNTKQTIIVKLDEQKNSVVIKNEVKEEYNFQESHISEFDYTYCVRDEQQFIKFKSDGENLNVYTATVTQNIREDTMGGGNWIVVDLNNFSDLLDEGRRDWLAFGASKFPIEKTSYKVPQGYKVTDGVSPISSEIIKIRNK